MRILEGYSYNKKTLEEIRDILDYLPRFSIKKEPRKYQARYQTLQVTAPGAEHPTFCPSVHIRSDPKKSRDLDRLLDLMKSGVVKLVEDYKNREDPSRLERMFPGLKDV